MTFQLGGAPEALSSLYLLLGELPEKPPPELRAHVLEVLRALTPFYRTRISEWEQITADVRAKIDLDVDDYDEHTTKGLPPMDRIEDIVTSGFIKDYLDYTRESEAPTQFHVGAILTCVSAALARRPLLGWQAAPLYPNIYSLLVGPTGTRKSSALALARRLTEEAFPKIGPAVARVNLLPSEGSPQGFAAALRNRSLENGGLSDGLIIASELTVLVSKDTYKAALGSWLTDWYDNFGDTWDRTLKSEVYVLPKPYVCFAGASNMTWLRELPESLIKAGYMPRHLVFNAKEKRHTASNPRFDPALRAQLIDRLRAMIAIVPDELPLSVESALLLKEWYDTKIDRQERGEVDELFAAWISRKLPHALKVATVWQIADGGPMDALHEQWLRLAIRLVDWMDAGVLHVYYAIGSTSEGAVTTAVLAYVERKGGKASVKQVTRGLRNTYNKRSIMSGVDTLLLAGLLLSVQEPGVGFVLTMVEGKK